MHSLPPASKQSSFPGLWISPTFYRNLSMLLTHPSVILKNKQIAKRKIFAIFVTLGISQQTCKKNCQPLQRCKKLLDIWALFVRLINQQRPSRFDTPGSGGGGFNGNPRGNLPPGGGMSGAAPGQPVGVIGGNFGGPNMPPGNMGGGGGNPRPLMDDLHEHGGGEFGGGAPKRPRRF